MHNINRNHITNSSNDTINTISSFSSSSNDGEKCELVFDEYYRGYLTDSDFFNFYMMDTDTDVDTGTDTDTDNIKRKEYPVVDLIKGTVEVDNELTLNIYSNPRTNQKTSIVPRDLTTSEKRLQKMIYREYIKIWQEHRKDDDIRVCKWDERDLDFMAKVNNVVASIIADYHLNIHID